MTKYSIAKETAVSMQDKVTNNLKDGLSLKSLNKRQISITMLLLHRLQR
jgi:hypothetical protein